MYRRFLEEFDNVSISILSDPQRTRQESLEYVAGVLYAITELAAADGRVNNDYTELMDVMDDLWKRCWKRAHEYKPN